MDEKNEAKNLDMLYKVWGTITYAFAGGYELSGLIALNRYESYILP